MMQCPSSELRVIYTNEEKAFCLNRIVCKLPVRHLDICYSAFSNRCMSHATLLHKRSNRVRNITCKLRSVNEPLSRQLLCSSSRNKKEASREICSSPLCAGPQCTSPSRLTTWSLSSTKGKLSGSEDLGPLPSIVAMEALKKK